MPDDIKNVATTWTSVTPAQDETWQVILGKARISLDNAPALGSMPAESGLVLFNYMAINVYANQPVRFKRMGASPVTIARSAR